MTDTDRTPQLTRRGALRRLAHSAAGRADPAGGLASRARHRPPKGGKRPMPGGAV